MRRCLVFLLAFLLAVPLASAQIGLSGTSSTFTWPNDPTTGTTVNLLAKVTSTGALTALTTDSAIPLYVVTGGAGITGSSALQTAGPVLCVFDDAQSNTAGFFVVRSTIVAGRCHAQSAAPGSGYVIGVMNANATTAGGLAQMVSMAINYSPGTGPGVGTVTSVGLLMPGIFSVLGSPIASSGTFNVALNTQTANLVLAGPATGAAAAPTFRTLVAADLPGGFPVAADPTGTVGALVVPGVATTFMRSDASPPIAGFYRTRTCTIVVGDVGAASPVLADDNDTPRVCTNDSGADVRITSVACYANAGTPTVTPILTGGSATSILTGPLTCGNGTWTAGAVNGTPIIKTFSGGGATCAVTPCSVDANITTAGGVVKYLVIKITGQL